MSFLSRFIAPTKKTLLFYVIFSFIFFVVLAVSGLPFVPCMKDQIVDHNWDLYDMSHAVVPTKLDLKEFYAEYQKLWEYHQEPIPVEHHMNRLASKPAEEVQEIIVNMRAFEAAMGTLYADHRLPIQVG